MVAKSCCYLLYTSFQASFSSLDFLLLKPLVQTRSSFASSVVNFAILGLLDSHFSPYYFYPDECGTRKKKNPHKLFSAIIRSRSPSSHCLSLPTSSLWSSFCASFQLCICITFSCLQAPCPISLFSLPLHSGGILPCSVYTAPCSDLCAFFWWPLQFGVAPFSLSLNR